MSNESTTPLVFVAVFEGRVIPKDPSAGPADLEAHFDAVMDELLVLGVDDPAIEADLAEGHVRMSIAVQAENPIGAMNRASGTLRSAVHAAGGATPDWPALLKDESWGFVLDGLNVGSGALASA